MLIHTDKPQFEIPLNRCAVGGRKKATERWGVRLLILWGESWKGIRLLVVFGQEGFHYGDHVGDEVVFPQAMEFHRLREYDFIPNMIPVVESFLAKYGEQTDPIP
jgi:hypothetical protein